MSHSTDRALTSSAVAARRGLIAGWLLEQKQLPMLGGVPACVLCYEPSETQQVRTTTAQHEMSASADAVSVKQQGLQCTAEGQHCLCTHSVMHQQHLLATCFVHALGTGDSATAC